VLDLPDLAIGLAEAMTRQPMILSDAEWAALRQRFSEAQLVELVAAIAWENFRARMNHAFGLESEGFAVDGAACLLPPRREAVVHAQGDPVGTPG
jgi:hypothetical protein